MHHYHLHGIFTASLCIIGARDRTRRTRLLCAARNRARFRGRETGRGPDSYRSTLVYKIKADAEQAAAAHTKAIADYERQLALAAEQAEKDAAIIKELQAKLAEASVEAVKASEASASLSAASAKSALEATELILARAESLEASRKAESLDGFTPEPAK